MRNPRKSVPAWCRRRVQDFHWGLRGKPVDVHGWNGGSTWAIMRVRGLPRWPRTPSTGTRIDGGWTDRQPIENGHPVKEVFMITAEQNQRLTETSAGTGMGELLR